jgi:hypothetical protein
LRFWRCAIDLVRQQQLAEDRAAIHHKAAGLKVKLIGADDVAGQQIRRELYPSKLNPDACGETLRKQCFRRARWTFQKNVAAAKQRYQH